jgi:hypothetical protein
MNYLNKYILIYEIYTEYVRYYVEMFLAENGAS